MSKVWTEVGLITIAEKELHPSILTTYFILTSKRYTVLYVYSRCTIIPSPSHSLSLPLFTWWNEFGFQRLILLQTVREREREFFWLWFFSCHVQVFGTYTLCYVCLLHMQHIDACFSEGTKLISGTYVGIRLNLIFHVSLVCLKKLYYNSGVNTR